MPSPKHNTVEKYVLKIIFNLFNGNKNSDRDILYEKQV